MKLRKVVIALIKPRIRKNIYFDNELADFILIMMEKTGLTFSYIVNMIVRRYYESFDDDDDLDDV